MSNGAISGTLHKLTSGAIPDYWGEGYFMALAFENPDENATSIKVGMYPSEGSGLVELLGDPDMNGVFKVTDKAEQVFRAVTTDGTQTKTIDFDLSGLVMD